MARVGRVRSCVPCSLGLLASFVILLSIVNPLLTGRVDAVASLLGAGRLVLLLSIFYRKMRISL